jgi:hypothetical protein
VSDAAVIAVVIALGGVCVTLTGGLIWAARTAYVAVSDRSDALVALANERAARQIDAMKITAANDAVGEMKAALDATNARLSALENADAQDDVPPGAGVDRLRKLSAAGEPSVPAAAAGGGAGPASGDHGG